MTVGTISGNPPWEFTTPDGQLDGYDIGIAKAIAEDLDNDEDLPTEDESGEPAPKQAQPIAAELARV